MQNVPALLAARAENTAHFLQSAHALTLRREMLPASTCITLLIPAVLSGSDCAGAISIILTI